MDEAREGIVFFLVNYSPGASKLRALHYKRRILHRCVPPLLCFPHRQSYHLSCALLLWTDPGACGQRLFGSNVSVQSPFLETQGRSARGSESQLGDQGQCCRHREPCVTLTCLSSSCVSPAVIPSLSVSFSLPVCIFLPVGPHSPSALVPLSLWSSSVSLSPSFSSVC